MLDAFRVRSHRFLFVLNLLICLGLAAPSFAETIIVDADAGPGFDYLTIQDAVSAAADCDTIVVRPGLYAGGIVITGLDNLHLVAAEQPDFVGASEAGVGAPGFTGGAVIDGGGAVSCLSITDGSRVSVTGFTMTNCLGQGIFLGLGADFTKLHNNSLYGIPGVGIAASGAQGVNITSNWITQTEQHAIRLANVNTAHIADNVLTGSAFPGMVGIRVNGGSEHIQIVNNEITAFMGAGIRDSGFKTRMERNTLQWNCLAPSPCGSCDCQQILTCPGSDLADVVGNQTFPPGSWAFCGLNEDVAENL